MSKLVSIVTTCYNGERFLDTLFSCVLSQTYDNLELVFVNNGSVDGTEMKYKEWEPQLKQRGVKLIYDRVEINDPKNVYNRGLKILTGEYVVFCDCDDILEPTFTEKMFKKIDTHPEMGFVHCNFSTVNSNDLEVIITDSVVPHSNRFDGYAFESVLNQTFRIAPTAHILYRTCDLISVIPDGQLVWSTPTVAIDYQLVFFGAAKKDAGFVDEVLCKFVLHLDSEYQAQISKFTYEKLIEGNENFYKFLVKYCTVLGVNSPRHLTIINNSFMISKFSTAAGYGRTADAKRYYKEMRKIIPFKLNLFIRYVVCYFPWLQKILRKVFVILKLREPAVK